VSHIFLSAPIEKPVEPGATGPILELTLESMDGVTRIPLNAVSGYSWLAGSVGLEMPPVEVISAHIPGVAGAVVQDVRVEQRNVIVPIFVGSRQGAHTDHLVLMDRLRRIVDPLTGTFRIVGTTRRGERELVCTYTGGLEGDDSPERAGVVWNRVALTALATDPFAQARSDRLVEFQAAGGGGVFLGTAGGTDAPWPRALSSSAVIGDNMRVNVTSEVPVYPTVELVGPMDSFTGTVQLEDASLPPYFGGAPWSVSIPQGVPAGSTLRLVTDPRARSVRLDGQLAAGRVALGSTLRPFYPGVNVMSVSAPGGTSETRVRIRWREKYRSLW